MPCPPGCPRDLTGNATHFCDASARWHCARHCSCGCNQCSALELQREAAARAYGRGSYGRGRGSARPCSGPCDGLSLHGCAELADHCTDHCDCNCVRCSDLRAKRDAASAHWCDGRGHLHGAPCYCDCAPCRKAQEMPSVPVTMLVDAPSELSESIIGGPLLLGAPGATPRGFSSDPARWRWRGNDYAGLTNLQRAELKDRDPVRWQLMRAHWTSTLRTNKGRQREEMEAAQRNRDREARAEEARVARRTALLDAQKAEDAAMARAADRAREASVDRVRAAMNVDQPPAMESRPSAALYTLNINASVYEQQSRTLGERPQDAVRSSFERDAAVRLAIGAGLYTYTSTEKTATAPTNPPVPPEDDGDGEIDMCAVRKAIAKK